MAELSLWPARRIRNAGGAGRSRAARRAPKVTAISMRSRHSRSTSSFQCCGCSDRRVLWLGLFGGIFGFALALRNAAFHQFRLPDQRRRPAALRAVRVRGGRFELTVLFAALIPAIGMLALNGLPRLAPPGIRRRRISAEHRSDRFFLCVLAGDEKFDVQEDKTISSRPRTEFG